MSIIEEHHKYNPLKRVLESIHELLNTKTEIHGDSIFCPYWNLTITPNISQCENRLAVVGFYIRSSEFDEPMYECCAGTGKDTDSAIGSCVGSFVFSFMNGFAQMNNRENPIELNTDFGGEYRALEVYISSMVGIGESVDEDECPVYSKYWDMLKTGIEKRLGKRNVCCVKIFVSKAVGKEGTQITGEVRINDIVSRELSEKVSKHAESWNVTQFASQKQFFFIRSKETVYCPYFGEDGRRVLRSKVKKALEIYAAVDCEEAYKSLLKDLRSALNDATLAQECYSFLPEMCAENAFPDVEYSEEVTIHINGKDPVTCCKSALSDYYPLAGEMFALFSGGELGEKTNDIYRLLIGMSGTYQCIEQFRSSGSELKNLCISAFLFEMDSDFEIR